MLKKYLILFLVSMVPIIELRGAMVMAAQWRMSIPLSLLICVIGNMLPVPIIYFFARKVLEWGSDKKYIGKWFTWFLEKGHKGGKKLEAKAGKGLFWALFVFVAIPAPGTGAWTGTLAASILDIGFKKSVIAVLMGVIVAGMIIGVLSNLGFAYLFGI